MNPQILPTPNINPSLSQRQKNPPLTTSRLRAAVSHLTFTATKAIDTVIGGFSFSSVKPINIP